MVYYTCWFIKGTSDKIVISYIELILSTSTNIVYAGRNRRSTIRSLFDIMTRYTDCAREQVRLFVSTAVIMKSSNVTPVDDYK